MRRAIYIIILGVIATMSACTSKSEPQKVEQDTVAGCYVGCEYESNYNDNETTEQATMVEQPQSGEAHVPLPKQSYMDEAEDAYEEGRALREESRLSGNPYLNEGDYDDEDYDDDYEDGWEDE